MGAPFFQVFALISALWREVGPQPRGESACELELMACNGFVPKPGSGQSVAEKQAWVGAAHSHFTGEREDELQATDRRLGPSLRSEGADRCDHASEHCRHERHIDHHRQGCVTIIVFSPDHIRLLSTFIDQPNGLPDRFCLRRALPEALGVCSRPLRDCM